MTLRTFEHVPNLANFVQEKQVHHLQRMKEKVKTPEGVPRLFDLIKVEDETIRPAFFALLGNTVVAEDIDQVGLHTVRFHNHHFIENFQYYNFMLSCLSMFIQSFRVKIF